MTDWNPVRAEFPALANWTFLNSATFGQMPRRGLEALQKHFARRDELACSDFMKWFDDMDAVRSPRCVEALVPRCRAITRSFA